MNIDFNKYKKIIDKAKSEKSMIEGEIRGKKKMLKDRFNLDTTEEAEKKLIELEKEEKKIKSRMQDIVEELDKVCKF